MKRVKEFFSFVGATFCESFSEIEKEAKQFLKMNARYIAMILKYIMLCISASLNGSAEKFASMFFVLCLFYLFEKMLNHANIGNDIPVRKKRFTSRTEYGVAIDSEKFDDAIKYLSDIEDYLVNTGKVVYKE